MPDDEAPDSGQDSPVDEPAAPTDDGGTPAPESQDSQAESQIDWESRAKEHQAWGTQNAQKVSQYEQIISLAQQGNRDAIEWLGLALADAEDDGEEEDETQTFQDPRVDQLLQAEAERQQEAHLDSLETHVDTEIDKLAKSASYELTDTERNLIFSALTPKDDGQTPDVEKAFKMVTGLRDAHIKSYREGKINRPQAPSGSAASHQPDLDNDSDRRDHIAELWAARSA